MLKISGTFTLYLDILDIEVIVAPPKPIDSLHIHFHKGHHMPNNTLTFNLPTARTDGSALALTDIQSYSVTKQVDANPAQPPVVTSGPFSAVAQSFVDPSPDFGSTDSYSIVVTDIEGNTSAAVSGSV